MSSTTPAPPSQVINSANILMNAYTEIQGFRSRRDKDEATEEDGDA